MSDQQPANLLIVMFDQLQQAVIGAYGGGADTPHFNRLAQSSAVFSRAYCSSPLCIPARGSIWTGLAPHAHGAVCFGDGYNQLRAGTVTMLDHLQQHGYDVCYRGIWHQVFAPGEDRTRSYDAFHEGDFPYAQHMDLLQSQGKSIESASRIVRTYDDEGTLVEWPFSLPTPSQWTYPIESGV